MSRYKVLIIVGPTASGKTALSVELARAFAGEVISADSRQVYRGLDIGTGKVTKKEMRGVPHHLLDVCSPKKLFSADDFVQQGRAAIEDIAERHRLPIVAGGTGFYVDAFTGRIVLPNVPPNEKLRQSLEGKTAAELYALLQKADPTRAATIEPGNPRRLIRALEIAHALGASPTPRAEELYDTLWIGLAPTQETLDAKIHARALARMKRGMVAEAKKLHAQGVSYKRMTELGLEYRSLARFLRGDITRDELVQEIEIGNRQYARKQMMYWKRNNDIQWFHPTDTSAMSETVRAWLKGN